MQLSSTLTWLVDAASASPGADRFLGELGTCLIADELPLAGGALTLAVPHPIIARRTWLWRAENGAVIEAVGFAGFGGAGPLNSSGDAGRSWLAALAGGEVHEDIVGSGPDAPVLGWIGPRPFTEAETGRLREAARFAAAPLAALSARATLNAALEAYLGRRSAARVLSGPLRREAGETIRAALLYADLRSFTALSEAEPPAAVIAALGAWFDCIAGAVHAFGGEVLKFIGDGTLAIFPVTGEQPRDAEPVRVIPDQVEGGQCPEGPPHECGVRGPREYPVALVDERHHAVQHKLLVGRGPCPVDIHGPLPGQRILFRPSFGVGVNGHDDDRTHPPGHDLGRHDGSHVQDLERLAVIAVEHRIAAGHLGGIAGREIHFDLVAFVQPRSRQGSQRIDPGATQWNSLARQRNNARHQQGQGRETGPGNSSLHYTLLSRNRS